MPLVDPVTRITAPLKVRPESVPDAMRAVPFWALWRLEERAGQSGVTKVPYRLDGTPASVARSSDWVGFDDAFLVYEMGGYSGLAFCFLGGFVGVDLDKVMTQGTAFSSWPGWVQETVTALDTYTEYSPSGTGLHCIARGKLPGRGRKDAQREMYDAGRYFTFTGHRVSSFPADVNLCQAALTATYEAWFPPDASAAVAAHSPVESMDAFALHSLLHELRRGPSGAKFSALFDSEDLPDQWTPSEAELALCGMAAARTKDPAMIDAVVRASKRFRVKWERDDYRERTIAKALSGEKVPRPGPPAREPETLLTALPVSRAMTTEPAPRRFLFEDALPAAKTVLLVGAGGTGKSMLILQSAVALATGTDTAWGWRPSSAAHVMVLTAEEDADELSRRLYACRQWLDTRAGNDFSEDQQREEVALAEQHLHILPRVGLDNRLLVPGDGGVLARSKLTDAVLEFASARGGVGLIVVDPVARFSGLDENRQDDMTRFVELAEAWVANTGAAVMLVHHVNKVSLGVNGERSAQSAARGASALTDGVRLQMNLSGATAKEARQFGFPETRRSWYARLSVSKTNLLPPKADLWLRRGNGGLLALATVTQDADAVLSVNELVALIRQKVIDDGLLDIKHTKTELGKWVAANHEVGRNRAWKLMDVAIERGDLAIVDKRVSV